MYIKRAKSKYSKHKIVVHTWMIQVFFLFDFLYPKESNTNQFFDFIFEKNFIISSTRMFRCSNIKYIFWVHIYTWFFSVKETTDEALKAMIFFIFFNTKKKLYINFGWCCLFDCEGSWRIQFFFLCMSSDG